MPKGMQFAIYTFIFWKVLQTYSETRRSITYTRLNEDTHEVCGGVNVDVVQLLHENGYRQKALLAEFCTVTK